ncbi:DUF4349 domain-containing protein [Galbibacter sp. EGI 63066]|uniref:DUF4349 domain-containing protein n=1 Tax=Galbibacter sp. EGI 63066 TaxID=2993559 RepID=UPI0022490AD5|nr:DUF4349 domain-containing protein [Galbibacter sp. EGI 63066]MCX2679254.1 DUF4349 domain-containing protein [Galbibacter sp. EGI 63066]
MKNLTQYFGLILLLSIFGCSQNSESAGMEMAADEAIAAPAPQQKPNESIERKLIKDGRVEFETDDLSATRTTIFEAVNKYEAYVSSDQEYNSPGRESNTVVIRVPADNFDSLLKDATQGIERFDSKEINVKDVTEEFLDIQARLKTKKELEKRYLELLKQAKDVTEILEVEKQIGQLRSDIESIEGRLQYLQDRVSFSTLTMTFYERIPDQTQFGKKFKNGFRNGWENLIWFFVGLINIWPFILILIVLIIGLRIYFRKKK